MTQATLDSHGAVSEACVREMVAGMARESKADLCVATSGVAGMMISRIQIIFWPSAA